jgi:outer membrane protein
MTSIQIEAVKKGRGEFMFYCLRAAARQGAALALAALLAVSGSVTAFAQETAPAAQPTQQPATGAQATTQANPQLPPVGRLIPRRTVGLEPGKVKRWTLRDAILAALENNPDIEIERSTVRQAGFDIIAAEGAYDPISTQGTTFTSTSQPNTRPFSGAGSAPALTSKNLNFNFGHQGFIYRTGGDYAVNFNNTRQSNNFSLFTSQYNPSLSFSVRQPVWRNYKIDRNRHQIQIAKRQLDLSDATFRQRVVELISRVQTAYWNLALAIKDEEIQRDSVKLAETQLHNNQRQVEVGTLAPIDVVQSAAVLESRRQQVLQAMETIAQAENTLKNMTANGTNDELWKSEIIPVESFEAAPLNMPLDDAFKLAMDNRPELKQFNLRKQINETDIHYLRNQTKPQIDLTFGYTTFGVGGAALSNPNCSPVTVNGQPVCAGLIVGTDAAGNLIPTIRTSPFIASVPTVSNNFIGGYGTGLRNLFSNDFRQWSVGVNVTLPWRNRTAKANLGRAMEVGRQLDNQTRRTMQNIEVEVRNAIQAIETAKMRIEAARAATEYARQQLEGEEKKFQAGLQTTFFVLQRQTELSQARGTELRALADYNKAVAELQRVISTTLTSNSIDIKSDAGVQTGDKKWSEIK